MRNYQNGFLRNELWKLSINAAFQRNRIYNVLPSKTPKENIRSRFRFVLRDIIEDLIRNQYAEAVISSEKHIENIQTIKDKIETEYGRILRDSKISVGTVQKVFNLYLKYLWCIGLVNEPPHCPFDRIIISKLNVKLNWTEIDTIKEYRDLVTSAQSFAGNESIARWELHIYENSRDS